ncbi:SGNH/GDSL hydrolase family protein [Novosphingobium sp. 9]|uniref:SGNH/GDSL hydrolase family protein n=1 Tax=Novosphingobium sp. 9 TaxID=2025349 RepID=UPI0021B6DEF0|nr:SGNH/GDSL hydrolase family protein [Novosphingobium sp. 9]
MATRCGQSANNYPSLLAKKFGLALIDHSCSGATTEHILGPWGDIPPQISGVNAATRLVTLTIGGNDLTYVGNLFNATCQQDHRRRQQTAVSTVSPCNPVRVPTEADYQRDEVQLGRIAQRIHQLAPRAKLVFVQYLQPLPATGKLCADTPISESDAEIIRTIGRRLSEIIDRVGRTNNALVVEMDKSSAAHTPCDADPWMIGSPKGYDGRNGLQWHLNLAGMKATADGIAYWLANAPATFSPAQPSATSTDQAVPPPNDPAVPTPPA